MSQSYFIFVVAHSIKGRIRRIHVPYYAIYVVAALAIVGSATVLGGVFSYSRMLLKTAHYNHLRNEVEALQKRYSEAQGAINGQQQQLASLQSLASEVSMAYGLKQVTKIDVPEDSVTPEYRNSLEQYRLLIRASYANPFQRQNLLSEHFAGLRLPNLWPVEGPITGSFGDRMDPFTEEGAFHAGVDISSPYGVPVKATADGVVTFAGRLYAGYGLMIDLDHGRSVVTRYAHLSGVAVSEGQAVTAGEIIGYVGRSGRSTGSHLHYEVRVNGGPVNPMKYMGHGQPAGFKKSGLTASLGSDD